MKNEILARYVYNEDSKNQIEISKNTPLEIKANPRPKENCVIEMLRKISNGKISINETPEGTTKIDIIIFMDLNQKIKAEFTLLIHKNKKFFDYIPNEINFSFKDKNDEIFFNELEIPNEDIGKLITKFLSLRKY